MLSCVKVASGNSIGHQTTLLLFNTNKSDGASVAASYQLPRNLPRVQSMASRVFACLHIIVYVRQMLCHVMLMHM